MLVTKRVLDELNSLALSSFMGLVKTNCVTSLGTSLWGICDSGNVLKLYCIKFCAKNFDKFLF